jgi:hypothetical protein
MSIFWEKSSKPLISQKLEKEKENPMEMKQDNPN